MKQSVIYLAFFALGIALAIPGLIPSFFIENDLSKWILYLLLFFVGIQIGTNKNILNVTKSVGFKIMLVPLATTIGTFAGAIAISFLLNERSITDCLSVGAGFAYYSLSSIIITEYRGAELGTIALLANIIREFFVLLLAPWIVKYFGKLAPISAGGATTMDTTLPIISRYSGSDYVIIALFHGIIIDFSVPIWVSLFLSL
ncbi:MAG TPA: lysine exporter LysO family protein [Dysgonamonadaceae bacterium]|nr:lysine exporter LysO family protein [Candidatus Cloacimonadota bacterium]HZJ80869.1 lysine exporter LysO family protein [Dysgonamonadaceae bacterium]